MDAAELLKSLALTHEQAEELYLEELGIDSWDEIYADYDYPVAGGEAW